MSTRMKGNERRAAILEAAVRRFAERGFRGTTTRQLASDLGVSEPVLYQHFPTKKDLYTAIIEETACEDVEAAEELQNFEGTDREFFVRLGHLILDRYEEDPGFIRLLLFSSLERHELSEMFFQNHVQRFYDMVSGHIRGRIQAGGFRGVDPMVAARAFIGMIGYHGLTRVLFQDQMIALDRQRLVEEMVELFLEGIRSH
jgi:AcrR family transcriptional regulator